MEPKNKSAVATNTPQQSSKQKAQKSQFAGPTISGVAGVGKAKTITRPKSTQSTTVGGKPTGVKTAIPHIGEARDSEFSANKHLSSTVRQKVAQKLSISGGRPQQRPNHQPGSGLSDYYAHNAKKTMKEEAPAMSAGGAGDPGQVQNATSNYALQKKMRDKMTRRKMVK